METTVRKLKEEMQCMLTGNILPFWMNHMVDSEYGGFYVPKPTECKNC